MPQDVTRTEEMTGCAIKLDYNSNVLYISIRGHNSISSYKINNKEIDFIQNVSCKGSGPRDIYINSSNNIFFCVNQLSNNLAIYEIKEDFRLNFKASYEMEKPSCVIM